MRYTIIDDRLYCDGKPVPYRESPNVSGRMNPELIVMHGTASSSAEGALSWMTQKRSKVSAHLLIDRDGSVTQMVPFDRQAWHAGRSRWRGRKGCNAFSIGIEMQEPGKLIGSGKGARSWFGETYDIEANGLMRIATPTHGDGWWMPFTAAQEAAAEGICMALVDHYPIKDIVGHYDVSPGRKVDPSPTYDMEGLRAACYGEASEPEFRTLTVGSSGRDVRLAQQRLRGLGYDQVGQPDGTYGPMTRAAVLAWQAEEQRALTGQLDREAFIRLLGRDAKPMAIGEVSAAMAKTRKGASQRIEVTAGAGIIALAAEPAANVAGVSLWSIITDYLDKAVAAVGQAKSIGVSVDPKTASFVVGALVFVAIAAWARQTREGRR